jgi:hypothetical protein
VGHGLDDITNFTIFLVFDDLDILGVDIARDLVPVHIVVVDQLCDVDVLAEDQVVLALATSRHLALGLVPVGI